MYTYELNDFYPDRLALNASGKDGYIFEQDDLRALWSAYAAGRPLLVKGEPGTGKTQLAKAIAQHLGWAVVEEVINYHTELNDLFYHFDAVQRLADAQVSGNKGCDKNAYDLTAENYLSPGPMWWAFNWASALDQHNDVSCKHRPLPYEPEVGAYKKGVVLLLDEIDKAQPELTNGLLGALGNREFIVPYASKPIRVSDNTQLLVVITSNDEKELPKAFIRRCFVHTLKMETDSNAESGTLPPREQWLIERGLVHFGDDIAQDVYKLAARMLWEDRDKVYGDGYKPGLAEYIDLLSVLRSLSYDEQINTIEDIAQFALNKNA